MTLGLAKNLLERAGMLIDSNLCGREASRWFGAAIDSRWDCSEKLFFALQGEKTDGHVFAMDAIKQGGRAVVVKAEETAHAAKEASVPFLRVEEPLRALQELARAYRETLSLRVVAVTGSSGKTTTKEFLRSALEQKYRVQWNPGNYNNHIGVPLTILGTREDSEYLVSEIGANHSGEVGFLSSILQPDVGVVTNIGDAHIGNFGGREAIAEAKAEMLETIPASGCAVLPGDDDFLELLKSRCRCRVVTFGFSAESDCTIKDYRSCGEGTEFSLNGRTVRLKLKGKHNVLNAAAAAAVANVENADFDMVQEAIAKIEPLEGRGKVYQSAGIILIDDSYNANPASMKASIGTLQEMQSKRKVGVFGDMKELGTFIGGLHEDLGEHLSRSGFDLVFWLGPAGESVRSGMESVGGSCKLTLFSDIESLIPAVEKALCPGDAILVKGSHACQLERAVSRLVRFIERMGKN